MSPNFWLRFGRLPDPCCNVHCAAWRKGVFFPRPGPLLQCNVYENLKLVQNKAHVFLGIRHHSGRRGPVLSMPMRPLAREKAWGTCRQTYLRMSCQSTCREKPFSALVLAHPRPTRCLGDEAVLIRRFTGGTKRKDLETCATCGFSELGHFSFTHPGATEPRHIHASQRHGVRLLLGAPDAATA